MKFFKKLVFLIMWCGVSNTVSVHAQEYLDNALYVKFKETSSVSAKKFQRDVVPFEALNLRISQRKIDRNGFHREARSLRLFDNPILDRTFRIQFDSTENIEKIIRMLEKDPNVEYVEKIPIFKTYAIDPSAKAVPDDPYYQPIDGIDYMWYLRMVNAEEAWEMQSGNPEIIAAIVDGAIWGEHPELQIPSERQYNAGNVTEGNSAPPYDNQNLECHTIYSPDPNEDPCPPYSWSHGTHCAGVVGATNNNGEGIASLASGVTLLGVAANRPGYSNSVINGYEGIRWAAEKGAKVISCSWGGGSGGNTGPAILKTCYDNNITIVAAAGNDNVSDKSEPGSSMYVICVGSVDESGQKSSFSNYGSWVSITAPGGIASRDNDMVGIFSTTYCQSQNLRLSGHSHFNGKYYDAMSGTSMATPLVASLCALMLSRDNTLTPAEIKDILQNTSNFYSGNMGHFTPLAGTIDAAAALRAVDAAKFDAPVENLQVTKIHIDTVWLQWEAPKNSERTLLGYRVYRNGIVLDSCTTETSIIDTLVPSGDASYLVSAVYENGYISTRKEARADVPQLFTVMLTASPSAGGTVSGAGRFVENDWVKITATPNPGYKFKSWYSRGTVSTKPTYGFRIRENRSFTAIFEQDVANESTTETYGVTLAPNPTKDELHVSCVHAAQMITICDIQGRIILETDGKNQTELSLDVAGLKEGVYILRIQTANGIRQQKFVKL